MAGRRAHRTGPARHREPVSRNPPPKERGPPFVRGMRYFCRIHIGCPGLPVCKEMFPTTHCQSCATANVENEYVFEAAICGCGVSRSTRRLACSECFKAENESRNCSTEGCGENRHGGKAYCKSCRSLNEKRPMTCFLCGGENTRKFINAKAKKNKKSGHSRMHRLAYEGGVRVGEGGNDGRCERDRFMNKKTHKYSSKTCRASAAY